MRRPSYRIPRALSAALLAGSLTIIVCFAPGGASASVVATSGTGTTPSSPTATTVESYISTWLNNDRVARGLRPLRLDSRLRSIAEGRAATLASLGILSHSAPGNLSSQLDAAGINWYGWGEDIGWSSYKWGHDVAQSLYTMWRNSPTHWALMMSNTYNYVGLGLGYRWPDHATYASMVFGELPDHTAPVPHMTGATRSGSSATFTYSGTEVRLQTHTSGFKDFDVEYRVDGGAWKIIRADRTLTSITLTGRVSGHTYYIAVRARDRAGNVSHWSKPLHVTF